MSELGRRAGYSSTQVSNVISGTQKATADFTINIAKAMGEDPVALLRLAGHLPDAPPLTDTDEATCQAFRTLSASQKASVSNIVFDLAGVTEHAPTVTPPVSHQVGWGEGVEGESSYEVTERSSLEHSPRDDYPVSTQTQRLARAMLDWLTEREEEALQRVAIALQELRDASGERINHTYPGER